MCYAEQLAIQKCQTKLCGALKHSAPVFVSQLQVSELINENEGDLINSRTLDHDKILKALNILKTKLGSFAFLVNYLIENKMPTLAAELNSAKLESKCSISDDASFEGQDKTKMQIKLNTFIASVIEFYSGPYRVVESFDGHPEVIEDVWVDLQLEGNRHLTTDFEQIFHKLEERNCQVAIIRGQPGSGKTTLVKKIACSWAKQKDDKLATNRFDLILAASLREIQIHSDPLEMAVSYFLSTNGKETSQIEVEKLTEQLCQSNLKILVILDGLDEYNFQQNSFLANIFGSAIISNIVITSTFPIRLKYNLIVTSRPYVCQIINDNLLCDKWDIVGFTEGRQMAFVERKCKTEIGKKVAAKYLLKSLIHKEISQVPLLLSLVCSLADLNLEIPSNLTRLYEAFVFQLLLRSAKKGSIKTFDKQNWRKTDIVTTMARLSTLGVLKNTFVFNSDEMKLCGVEKESFNSGLLLFRSDPLGQVIKADFLHRSVQEFLAALNSVNIWSSESTISEETGWRKDSFPIEGISEMKVEMLVARMIRFGDSQFCRFYFGLLSGQQEFEVKMRKPLQEYQEIYLIHPHFLFSLSNSLADCSDAECFLTGQIVNSLVDKCFSKVKSGWTEVKLRKRNIFKWTEENTIDWPAPTRTELRPQLQSGLKLKWLGNFFWSFYLRSESQTQLKMIWIRLNLVEKVGELEDFEQVEWLWIDQPGSFGVEKLKFAFDGIKRLPKCRNCGISDWSAEPFVIRLLLGRKSECPVNSGVNPEFIFFEVERSLGEKILRKLSSLRQSDSGVVEIESIEVTATNARRVRLAFSNSWSVWDFLRSKAEWS